MYQGNASNLKPYGAGTPQAISRSDKSSQQFTSCDAGNFVKSLPLQQNFAAVISCTNSN